MYQTFKMNNVKKLSIFLLIIFLFQLVYSLVLPAFASASEAVNGEPSAIVQEDTSIPETDQNLQDVSSEPMFEPIGTFPVSLEDSLVSQADCGAMDFGCKTKEAIKDGIAGVIALVITTFIVKPLTLAYLLELQYSLFFWNKVQGQDGESCGISAWNLLKKIDEKKLKESEIFTECVDSKSSSVESSYYSSDPSLYSQVESGVSVGDDFQAIYRNRSLKIGFAIIPLMMILTVIFGIILNKPIMIWHMLIRLPIVGIGIYAAPKITNVVIDMTDIATADMSGGIVSNFTEFIRTMVLLAVGTAEGNPMEALIGLLLYIVFMILLVIIFVMIWFLLLMREANIAIILFFIPFFYGASVFPVVSAWGTRATKFLLTTIISKFFILGTLGLGFSYVIPYLQDEGGGQLDHLLMVIVISAAAAFSPTMLTKIIDDTNIHEQESGGTGGLAKVMMAGSVGTTMKELSKGGA
jgi:hypothetical protein